MPAIVLFGSRLSAFVEKVARALELKRLEFETVEPRSPTDFRKWNPQTGKIPVLELDGQRLYDSTFILRRLDERFPDPPLLSADPATAAAQRLLEDWADESLYWMLMALRWTPRNQGATAEQLAGSLPIPGFAKPLVRAILTRRIGGMARVQGFGRLPYERLAAALEAGLDDLAAVLGARPFFHADAPSAADLALYGEFHMGASGPTPEFDRWLDARPALREWQKRVEQATGG